MPFYGASGCEPLAEVGVHVAGVVGHEMQTAVIGIIEPRISLRRGSPKLRQRLDASIHNGRRNLDDGVYVAIPLVTERLAWNGADYLGRWGVAAKWFTEANPKQRWLSCQDSMAGHKRTLCGAPAMTAGDPRQLSDNFR